MYPLPDSEREAPTLRQDQTFVSSDNHEVSIRHLATGYVRLAMPLLSANDRSLREQPEISDGEESRFNDSHSLV
jgi:hypothetical protein